MLKKPYLLLLASALLFSAPAFAQPAIASPVNGASYIRSGLPGSSIAQGSIFVIFGQRLGPNQIVEVDRFPLPTANGLAGTSVQVTVAGTTVDAIMLSTFSTQVAAVLPSNTPIGTGTVTVAYNGQRSAPAPITVTRSSVGLFALNKAGSGPAILQNYISQTEAPLNNATTSARPGQVVILWGTGLGPVTGNEAAGPLPGNITGSDLRVFVGGREAAVQYRGRSGCCVGVDQINFVVPSGIEGCSVPVYVQANGVVSNFVSMSIAASGTTCSDPNGYSTADLLTASANGAWRPGVLGVQRVQGEATGVPAYRSDSLIGSFSRIPYSRLFTSTEVPMAGQCSVIQYPTAAPPPIEGLDAGEITVTGPVGNRTLGKPSKGVYLLAFMPSPVPVPNVISDGTLITAGNYTFNVTGGADVGPVTASINFPASFSWTNHASITSVTRSQPLNITWSGGTSGALVNIRGTSSAAAGPDGDIGVSFSCWEDATKGSFTVPASLLSALPASYTESGIPAGTLTVSEMHFGNPFTATGIDQGVLEFFDSYSKGTVAYR
ncbi:MAG: hypothetical protein HUU41_13120 [Bryobacteraceae bacterium]|nr:hypothetical protein [Bryobacterales bacterium]MEB2360462.1 hypothetical protein [Bryobacterales bacterium]NUN02050.1 hypothetical protein [Bryobacteraceae bacterium]